MIYYNGSTANEKYVIHNNTYVPFALKNGTPIALFDDNAAPDFNNMTISNIDASGRILDTMFITDPYYCDRKYNYAYSNSTVINTFYDGIVLNERVSAPYMMKVNNVTNAYRPVFFANNITHDNLVLLNFVLLGTGYMYNNSSFIDYKATNCLFYNVKFSEIGQQLSQLLTIYNNNYKGTLFNRCNIDNIYVVTDNIFTNSGNAYTLSPMYNVCNINILWMFGGICNGCNINNVVIRNSTTRFNGCNITGDVATFNNIGVSIANSNVNVNNSIDSICNNMNVYKSNFRGSNALNFIFCSKNVTINNARIISQPTIWYFNMVANNYTRNIDINGLYTANYIFILRNSRMPTISYTRYNNFKLCNLNHIGFIGLNTVAPIANNGTYNREWNVNIKDILISGYMDPRASSFNFYDTSYYNSNTSNAVIFDDNTSRTNIHISNIRVYNNFNVFLAQSFNNITYIINPLIQGKFVNNINCMPVYNNYTSSFNVEYKLYGNRSLVSALIGIAGVANIGDVLCYNSFISDITVLYNKDLYINIYTSSTHMHHTNAIFAWNTTYNYQNKKGLVNNIRFIQPFEYYPGTWDEFDQYSDPSELPTFGSDILNIHCRCSNIFIPARNSTANNNMYNSIFNMSNRGSATNFLAAFIGFNRAAFINSRASYTATNSQYCVFSVNMKDYPDVFSQNSSDSIVTVDYAGNSFRVYKDSRLENMWDDNVINYSMPTTLRFICNIYNVTPSTTTTRDISFKVNWG